VKQQVNSDNEKYVAIQKHNLNKTLKSKCFLQKSKKILLKGAFQIVVFYFGYAHFANGGIFKKSITLSD